MREPEPHVAAELAAKADELRAQIARLTAPAPDQGTIGFGKRIGDGTTQAIQQLADAGAAALLQSTLDQVVRAQAKLADGTWGACDGCGGAIDPDRLDLRPWSTTCVACADRSSRRDPGGGRRGGVRHH